jgi:hypothetical protein
MRQEKKKQVKIKPKFNLKGIPASYKWIAEIAIKHATTQTECEELFLHGIKTFEATEETETPEELKKIEVLVVTQAIKEKAAISKETI